MTEELRPGAMLPEPQPFKTVENGDRDRTTGQFLPGNKMGPGRPRGIDVRAAYVKRFGEQSVEDAVVTTLAAMVDRASKGDPQCGKVVLERFVGPVLQKLEAEFTNANGQPQLSEDEIARRLASLFATAAARAEKAKAAANGNPRAPDA